MIGFVFDIELRDLLETGDVSNLLSRAGFTLTTVDIDEVTVTYPSMFELMEDLRDMGESNAVIDRLDVTAIALISSDKSSRRVSIKRDTLAAASAIYKELHGLEDGTIPATFQVIYMVGKSLPLLSCYLTHHFRLDGDQGPIRQSHWKGVQGRQI